MLRIVIGVGIMFGAVSCSENAIHNSGDVGFVIFIIAFGLAIAYNGVKAL